MVDVEGSAGSKAPHPHQFRADPSPPDPDPKEDVKEQRTWWGAGSRQGGSAWWRSAGGRRRVECGAPGLASACALTGQWTRAGLSSPQEAHCPPGLSARWSETQVTGSTPQNCEGKEARLGRDLHYCNTLTDDTWEQSAKHSGHLCGGIVRDWLWTGNLRPVNPVLIITQMQTCLPLFSLVSTLGRSSQ